MDLGNGWEVVLVDLLVESFLRQSIHAGFAQFCLQYHPVRPQLFVSAFPPRSWCEIDLGSGRLNLRTY
jgi:hypothetical protein